MLNREHYFMLEYDNCGMHIKKARVPYGPPHGQTTPSTELKNTVKDFNSAAPLPQKVDRVRSKGQCRCPSKDEKNSGNVSDISSMSNRERLNFYRSGVPCVAGIPDAWGGERNLREWVDWSTVNSALQPEGLADARMAMMKNRTKRQ